MLQTEDVSTEWGWPLCSLCVKAEYVQSALSLFHSSFPQTYRSKGFQGLRSYLKKLNCVKPAWIQSMYKFNVCLCCFSFVLCIFSPYCQNSQNSAHHRIAVLERHTEGERALCPWARYLVESWSTSRRCKFPVSSPSRLTHLLNVSYHIPSLNLNCR